MARVQAKFQHPDYEIEITVLQPTKGESDYGNGMNLNVDWDGFTEFTVDELNDVADWIKHQTVHIKNNFDKDGNPKK